MNTQTDVQQVEFVVSDSRIDAANVLPRVMAGVLIQVADLSEWPTLIAQAVATLAVEETWDPEEFVTQIATAILEAIPYTRDLHERREARLQQLAELIKDLPRDARFKVGNALGL